MAYTNSPLVNYVALSPNHSGKRTHEIDTITIHCVVGQVTVQRLGQIFAKASRQASCNYGIGLDGKIGMYVEEKNRSWCTSSRSNDQRAITIEVASDNKSPYKITDKAYASLLNLVTDICKRNNIKKLIWKGDKTLIGKVDKQNMTAHKWFANKACPGDYLYKKHGEIATEVNKRLEAANKPAAKPATTTKEPAKTTFKSYKIKVKTSSLTIRKGPGTTYAKVGTIKDKGTYTIIDEAPPKGSKYGWGKLKSGLGWVSLSPSYVTKL